MKIQNVNDYFITFDVDMDVWVKEEKDTEYYYVGATKNKKLTIKEIDDLFFLKNLAKGAYYYYGSVEAGEKTLIDSNDLSTIIHDSGTETQKSFFKPQGATFKTFYPKLSVMTIENLSVANGQIKFTGDRVNAIDAIKMQHVKKDITYDCTWRKTENNEILVDIPEGLPRGNFKISVHVKAALDEWNSLHNGTYLTREVPERFHKVTNQDVNEVYAYITPVGYLYLQVINQINNHHFNQLTGKLIVNNVQYKDDSKNSIVIQTNANKDVDNLSVSLMNVNTDEAYEIPFKGKAKFIEIDAENLQLSEPKLIVVKFNDKGILQNRRLDFGKWLKKNLSDMSIRSIGIQEETGLLNLQFSLKSLIPIKGLEITVQNRVTKEEIHAYAYESNDYICAVNVNNLPMLPNQEDSYLNERYDENVFDFFIRPIIDGISIINNRFKLEYVDSFNDEYWFKKDENTYQLLMLYKTKDGNISARLAFLPADSYKYYKQHRKDTFDDNANKKQLVVAEYMDKAQDTGLLFFKYMVDHHSDEFDTYYVITEHSKDLNQLSAYMDHVVFFRSVEHIKLMMSANYLAHSNSSIYAFPFNSKRMNEARLRMKKIFLQHGIMGVRDLSGLYNNNPLFTNKIVVSSEREKNIAMNKMGYQSNNVALTGLSRFDRLIQHRKDNNKELKKKILIMPSWRKGQNELTDEDFKKTAFYQTWENLLNNQEFMSLVTENKLEVNFYLHHNFQKYTHLFNANMVNFIPEGQYSVQDLLISHGVLITDFSSVGLDFSLLNRPVVYYNFDNAFDLEEMEKVHFLPGQIISGQDELLMILQKTVKRPKLKWKYRLYQKKNLYKFSDQSANERIYRELLSIEDI